jgi:ribosomal protein L11 methylase PrmA
VNVEKDPGSFRDPNGYVARIDGQLLRVVRPDGAAAYDQLMASGLYAALIKDERLVSHEEVDVSVASAHRVLRPALIPFISYPYEWSFGQLRAAALLTLDLARTALNHGMELRDASAYNVQFRGVRPVFIDTLSFGPYAEGSPWVAYGQFCRHFLAPLALMSRVDVGLSQLLRVYIDGVPLPLASSILPASSWLSPSLAFHLHMHARSTVRHADDAATAGAPKAAGGMSKTALVGMLDSLYGLVEGMSWVPAGTEWAEYYDNTNYTKNSEADKERAVAEVLGVVQGRGDAVARIWDLGANTGKFSAIAAKFAEQVMAFDIDPGAVERHFRANTKAGTRTILPLLQDLTNPSSGIGWDGRERSSLQARGPADVAMALALIHHIAISNNVPLPRIAEFFAGICRYLVIEFVPKADSQVRRLLATRPDIFPDYTIEGFEAAFSARFTIVERRPIAESERTLYLLQVKP